MKKHFKLLSGIFTFVIAAFIVLVPVILNAQIDGGNPPKVNIEIPNPLKNGTDSLYGFIKDVINNILLPVGGVIVVIMIIYSGFMFVTARGNEAKLATAKKNFLFVAIGTAVLLGAWVIATVIENTIKQLTA